MHLPEGINENGSKCDRLSLRCGRKNVSFLVKPDRVNQPLDDGWLMIINAVGLAVQYFLGIVLIHCGKFDCSNILQLTYT
jgi:hypothetical protein